MTDQPQAARRYRVRPLASLSIQSRAITGNSGFSLILSPIFNGMEIPTELPKLSTKFFLAMNSKSRRSIERLQRGERACLVPPCCVSHADQTPREARRD
jgi:hypothetical protein